MEITRLSDRLAISPQLAKEDIASVAAAGFVGIVNNRPDGEAPEQPTSLELESEARRHGLLYWHVPVTPGEGIDREVRLFAAALEEAPGPILAFCRTGNRSAGLWKAAQALS